MGPLTEILVKLQLVESSKIAMVLLDLGSFATYLGVQTSLYTELFGAIMSIEMDLSKGWQKLWQEGDSFFIV